MYILKYVCIKNLFCYIDWPSVVVSVDKACITSVNLSLTIDTNQSTCHLSSYHLYLVSSDREISPYSRKDSHYQFNELASNSRHTIQVAFTDGVNVHTVSPKPGYVNTPASLRMFLSSYNILARVHNTRVL